MFNEVKDIQEALPQISRNILDETKILTDLIQEFQNELICKKELDMDSNDFKIEL